LILAGRAARHPGPRNAERFSETIGVRRVDFPLATWDPFLNVNTPAGLAMARAQADLSQMGDCASG
jgi:molybdopterin-guanine dinucleotide biosynthesis protein A